ncbi:MAG: nucleotidyltransferase family protein [Bacteroidales bacterium]|nr:nucleotidyltransferase family protein [Bacteroidales bacterium]
MDRLRELIQISIGKLDRFSTPPSESVWKRLYAEACKQAILGVTYRALETVPAEQLTNPDIVAKWKDKKEKIAIMCEVYEDHNRRVARTLGDFGFRCTFLKGEGLAFRFYPAPLLRQCGDIDVWVDGGRKEIIRTLRRQYRIWNIYYHECKVGFFPHLTVEAHFIPVRMYNPRSNRRLQKYFEARKDACMRAEVPGRGYPAPDAPFNAIYLMAHILRHVLNGGVGLRHIWDYYYVVLALTPEQRETARLDLRRLGLGGIAAEVSYILSDLFGMDDATLPYRPARRRGRKLIAEILSEGNFGIGRKKSGSGKGLRRNLHYLGRFPSEVLWIPVSRVWHFLWRKYVKLSY